LRELSDQAHGANLDLGHALIHDLTSVDPANIDVARFFALCGRRHSANYADRLTMRISRWRTREDRRRGATPPRGQAAVPLVARGGTVSPGKIPLCLGFRGVARRCSAYCAVRRTSTLTGGRAWSSAAASVRLLLDRLRPPRRRPDG
jgi:hypothetical protein